MGLFCSSHASVKALFYMPIRCEKAVMVEVGYSDPLPKLSPLTFALYFSSITIWRERGSRYATLTSFRVDRMWMGCGVLATYIYLFAEYFHNAYVRNDSPTKRKRTVRWSAVDLIVKWKWKKITRIKIVGYLHWPRLVNNFFHAFSLN